MLKVMSRVVIQDGLPSTESYQNLPTLCGKPCNTVNSKIQSFLQIPTIFRWKPAAWLAVSGEDAFPFLQGQFSNDLRPLQDGHAVYGLWLDRKGKVLADSFVVPDLHARGRFRIASYHSLADTIRQRLEDFVVADDVVVTDDTSNSTGLTVSDAAQNAAVSEALRRQGAIGFPGRRGFAAREWILPMQSASDASLVESLRQNSELTFAQMEDARIAARIPAIPRDIGPADLPQEGGLDADAVSFSKGCYLGQEVMARLKTMGSVRRRLYRVRSACTAPSNLPAPLFQNGKRIGELRTAVAREGEFVGLALLSTMNLAADSALFFAENDASPQIVIDAS